MPKTLLPVAPPLRAPLSVAPLLRRRGQAADAVAADRRPALPGLARMTPLAALCLAAGCASVPPAAAPGATAAPAPVSSAVAAPAPAPAPAAAPRAGAPTAAPGAAPGAAPAAAAAAAAPGQPQPFATVTKDAKKTDGLFTVWQKDEKVWLELRPEDFGKAFFLSPKIARGIGEAGLFGGTMIGNWQPWGGTQMVEFRRVHNMVQLLARNGDFIARAGTPEGAAVQAGFSPSLVASTPVASQPHPERKTVLIEANALFLNDMLGLGMSLQRSYRQGYAFDARNSAFTAVRGKPDAMLFEVTAHYATGSLSFPQPGTPPGTPAPSLPTSLPDARSLFFGLHYSISALPEVPMAARPADPRIGYFTTNVQDFSNDLARSPKQRFVNRWRLEKADPAAEISEPIKPITFWIDRTVPTKYRDALTQGILEWNKAFEKIGFRNAVVVKVQPEDADFDTLDIGVASVRWMTNSQPAFGAIGPSQVDPRSGEILDADIGFESLSSRLRRALRAQVLSSKVSVDWPALMQSGSEERLAGLMQQRATQLGACTHAEQAAEQLSYAMDVLEARGELDPAGPEAEAFVQAYLIDTTMHEVGHTLGLRHNFRSSRIYTAAQLADPEFTRANGLAGSVMEYAPVNLAKPGTPGGTPFQLALGPYDYWAIEYGYRPLPAEREVAELQRIASRSAEPALAYGTDEDNFLGIDPESLHFDLGDDVVAFARGRIEIARDLLARQESRPLNPERDYAVLRRSVAYAVTDAGRAAGVLARQIGGVRTLRDFPGTGRDPLQPVSPAVQRAALDLLATGWLSADSLRISAQLQRRLAPDYLERGDAAFSGDAVSTDFSLSALVLDMQRALLGQLMSDALAGRVLDSEGKVDPATAAFTLDELYGRLERAVWSELDRGEPIPAPRRELQREHVNKLSAALLRPGVYTRADARALVRRQGQALLKRIDTAARRGGSDAATQAHLADSADSLRTALESKLARQGS